MTEYKRELGANQKIRLTFNGKPQVIIVECGNDSDDNQICVYVYEDGNQTGVEEPKAVYISK